MNSIDDLSQTNFQAVISHGVISVTPNCTELMRGVFDHDEIGFSTDNGRLHFHSGGSVLVLDGEAHESIFPAGFASLVCKTIQSRGHIVNVVDRREVPSRAESADHDNEPTFDRKHPRLLTAINATPAGIIEYPRGRGRQNLIASLCQVLHHDRILIIVSTIDRAREVLTALHSRGMRDARLVRGTSPVPDSRVIVGTFATLRYARAETFSLLLLEDADEATMTETAEILRHEWSDRRVYAFRSSQPHSTRTRLIHEGMFGDRLFPQAGSQANQASTVTFAEYPAGNRRLANDQRSQAEALLSCSNRNRAVVEIARRWGESDLRDIDPNIATVRTPNWYSQGTNTGEIIIVAGSRRHADELTALLNDQCSGRGIHCNGSRHGITRPEGITVRVVTAIAISNLRSASADLVINACGGRDPGINAWTLAPDRNHLVIDFFDHWHAALAGNSRSRLRRYQQIGFSVDHGSLAILTTPESAPQDRPRRRTRRS